MELKSQLVFDHVGHNWRRTAQLGMTECITRALLGKEFTIRPVRPFRDNNSTEAMFFDLGLDLGHEFFLIKFHFREQDHNRNALVFNQSAGSSNPAGMTAHHLDDKNLGRRLGHGAHVIGCFKGGYRDVLRD